MALQKVSGMYQVLVADPANPAAEPQTVPVEVGLSDGTYTQIVRGLNEGDQVVVRMSSRRQQRLQGLRRWVHHAGGWQRASDAGGVRMRGAASMKRYLRILILVLIIAALGYGGYRFYQSRQTTAAAASGQQWDVHTTGGGATR